MESDFGIVELLTDVTDSPIRIRSSVVCSMRGWQVVVIGVVVHVHDRDNDHDQGNGGAGAGWGVLFY